MPYLSTHFLTNAELARELGVPIATVRYWRYAGTGPKGAKIGRRVLYLRQDVEAWVSAAFGESA
jgi:DNA-binding transcriptional MerR regulator